jgi:thioredoxin
MSDEQEVKKIREQKEEMLKKMIEGPAMPKQILHIDTVDQFNEIIEKYKDQIIVIDFWADWCGPCKMFGPVFEATQKSDWGNHFVFAKLDTEKLPGVSQQLQVMGIPMVMFIKGKKEIFRQSGALPRQQFELLLTRVKEAVEKMDKGSPMHS